jgi:hypothetical protein
LDLNSSSSIIIVIIVVLPHPSSPRLASPALPLTLLVPTTSQVARYHPQTSPSKHFRRSLHVPSPCNIQDWEIHQLESADSKHTASTDHTLLQTKTRRQNLHPIRSFRRRPIAPCLGDTARIHRMRSELTPYRQFVYVDRWAS